MATYTANHLLVSTVLAATAGNWLGEEAMWGMRLEVGQTDLNAGQHDLNTFDVHTDNKTRNVTHQSIPGAVSQPWSGEAAPATEDVTDEDIDAIIGWAVKFWVDVSAFINQNFSLASVRLYPTGADGKSPAGPVVWTPTGASPGIASAAQSPELAACVSLYTSHRAKAGRGRIYVGPLGGTVFSAAGTMSSAIMNTLPAAMKTFQDSVRARGTPVINAQYSGIVWNRHGPGGGAPHGTQGCTINRVRVGDEVDRQERRTKSRPEVYSNATVA